MFSSTNFTLEIKYLFAGILNLKDSIKKMLHTIET